MEEKGEAGLGMVELKTYIDSERKVYVCLSIIQKKNNKGEHFINTIVSHVRNLHVTHFDIR